MVYLYFFVMSYPVLWFSFVHHVPLSAHTLEPKLEDQTDDITLDSNIPEFKM